MTGTTSSNASNELRGRNPFTGRDITGNAMLAFFALLIAVPCLVVAFSTVKSQGDIIRNPISPPFPSATAAARLPDSCAAAKKLGTEPGAECQLTPNLQGYRDAAKQKIGKAFRNSLLVTSASVLITLILAAMTAFAVTRIGGAMSTVLFGFFALGMAVPSQVNGIAQYTLFSRLHLTNRLEGLVVVNIAATLPVSVFILTGFMRTLPKELFEAAVVDGASNWKLFRKVVVPLSVPSLAAVGIFLLVIHWNDLWYPILFITDPDKYTLPRTLAGFKGEFSTNYPALFAGVLIASAPLITAYVLLQRWFIAGLTSGAVKG
jgi:raffinose/stachyose/melibiose transport system permease protein